jgi:hypothetical protein
MLIQISETRWVAEPEVVYQEERCQFDSSCGRIENVAAHDVSLDLEIVHAYEPGVVWVARMPSGTLEWISDDEYGTLMAGLTMKEEASRTMGNV